MGDWYMSRQLTAGILKKVSRVEAVGGIETDIVINGISYRIHAFTSVGNDTITFTTGGEIEYLIVAGGGGGGAGGSAIRGGGAGAGGLLTDTMNISQGLYDIYVGDGGLGGITTSVPELNLRNGENSFFDTLIAIGGGHGGFLGTDGESGGSGGGAGSRVSAPGSNGGGGTLGQGNNGGDRIILGQYGGAGGGGATGAGGDINIEQTTGFAGGAGLIVNFDGTSKEYARGGDGGSGAAEGANGIQNSGNGGAGGGAGVAAGGDGGSGIVLIRYRR